MKRVLFLTVGGSCAPIITSIKQRDPDYVVFICSDDDPEDDQKGSYRTVIGEGKVCHDPHGPDQLNIITQVGWTEENYQIYRLPHPDSFTECYDKISGLLRDIRKQHPNAEIIADYTGGTKTMAATLVTAAMDAPGVRLGLVTGTRANLIKVTDRTQRSLLLRSETVQIDRQLTLVDQLISDFDYAGARRLLKDLQKVPPSHRTRVQQYSTLAHAFDAWDRFDHATAWKLLTSGRSLRKKFERYTQFLAAIIDSRQSLDDSIDAAQLEDFYVPPSATGFEVIEDLRLNAERRAHQGRYDDAVARLYRLTELTGQLLLYRDFDLDTGNLGIGLIQSFELLSALNLEMYHDVFQQHKAKVKDQLKVRNHSLLAHGFQAIGEADYKRVKGVLTSFVQDLLERKGAAEFELARQLPDRLDNRSKNQR